MNKKSLEILYRTLNNKFPFITGINFKETNNGVYGKYIIAYVDIDLSELADTFPTESVDYEYLEAMGNTIDNPYHAFHEFRDGDDSINDLVEVLSRSIGVEVRSVRFNIIH
jgi:hypothetical protein